MESSSISDASLRKPVMEAPTVTATLSASSSSPVPVSGSASEANQVNFINDSIKVMLVTANVGSIFEDPQVLLKLWIQEFIKSIKEKAPKFLALHCQEIGGKNYEDSMKHVDDFVTTLLKSDELKNYDKVRIFLDEDFTCTEKFTALGNLYFIDKSLDDVELFSFKDKCYVEVVGHEIHSGNIEEVVVKEKAKFPQEFFPECKWSRKGFIRTRWKIKNNEFDLINIHLFHDASNFRSIEEFPSVYTKTRQHALKYTLDKLSTDEYKKIPFFMFGDFNFRPDTNGVIKKITNNVNPIEVKSAKNGELEKLIFKESSSSSNCESKSILILGKKLFDFENEKRCEEMFFSNPLWLLEYDKELQPFEKDFYEFKIDFPPSYPFVESTTSSTYMKTRCPAWCDRILLSENARKLIKMDQKNIGNSDNSYAYGLLGSNVPMGDHKPIYLWFNLKIFPDENRITDMKNVQLNTKENLHQDISTRYVYVKYGDSPVTIFRETAV